MLQTIITYGIIALALWITIRRIYRMVKRKRGLPCGSCDQCKGKNRA